MSVWFLQSINIFAVVLSPIVAQAADYWGRKWFLVSLSLAGGVGSLIVSRASSFGMAVAGFCLIGASYGMQPLLHAVLGEILPRRWRPIAGAMPQVAISIGCILGYVVGAALNRTSSPTSNGFRKYFYMTTACYLFVSVVCLALYNPPPRSAQTSFTLRQKLAKLDWTGYVLYASSVVLFSVALSYSQNPYPWSNARVSATFAVGIALGLAFVFYEARVRTDGMFHQGLFSRGRNFALALFAIFFEGIAFFAITAYRASKPQFLSSFLPPSFSPTPTAHRY